MFLAELMPELACSTQALSCLCSSSSCRFRFSAIPASYARGTRYCSSARKWAWRSRCQKSRINSAITAGSACFASPFFNNKAASKPLWCWRERGCRCIFRFIIPLESFSVYFNALMMATNSAAFKDAPPTSPPSTSGWENSSAALAPFTLPPYRMLMLLATASPYLPASTDLR